MDSSFHVMKNTLKAEQSDPSSFSRCPSQMSSSVGFRDVGLPVRNRVIGELTIYGRAKSQDVECAAPRP